MSNAPETQQSAELGHLRLGLQLQAVVLGVTLYHLLLQVIYDFRLDDIVDIRLPKWPFWIDESVLIVLNLVGTWLITRKPVGVGDELMDPDQDPARRMETEGARPAQQANDEAGDRRVWLRIVVVLLALTNLSSILLTFSGSYEPFYLIDLQYFLSSVQFFLLFDYFQKDLSIRAGLKNAAVQCRLLKWIVAAVVAGDIPLLVWHTMHMKWAAFNLLDGGFAAFGMCVLIWPLALEIKLARQFRWATGH